METPNAGFEDLLEPQGLNLEHEVTDDCPQENHITVLSIP
jgi:hypothetical protein